MKNNDNLEAPAKEGAAYPYYDLEACIKFCTNIKELGGSKGAISKAQLAKQVGLAESTPSFFQRLSASKVFGIVQGWGAYGLTDLGRKYFYPQSESDKKKALLDMVSNAPVFKFILDRFDGETLPKTEILGNIFHQELSIPDSWKDRIAQIFARSASFAGIIDNNGFLRYSAEVHNLKSRGNEEGEIPPPAEGEALKTSPQGSSVRLETPTPIPVATVSQVSSKTIWVFSHRSGQIRVETPESITPDLWEKLNAYVQILKPSKGSVPE